MEPSMRPLLYATILATLAGPTLAQTAIPVTPQGVPPGANPETGARPGNEIGTGSSMPYSSRASNIDTNNTRSEIAPNLGTPAAGEDASPQAYLRAAQEALRGGRTGAAQQAMEMAETRLLNAQSDANDAMINEIRDALRALAAGDREQSMQVLNSALQTASAE
jgi:hypothetical protein